MDKSQKETVVAELKEKIERAATVVITDYRGLDVRAIANLRGELRGVGVEYKVYKNTLLKRAVDDIKLEGLDDFLMGPTAIAFSYDDAFAPAKVLVNFAKKNKALDIKGGLLDGQALDGAALRQIASLPSQEVLLAKLVGLLQAPIAGLANVLNAPVQGLAIALGQVAEQKQ